MSSFASESRSLASVSVALGGYGDESICPDLPILMHNAVSRVCLRVVSCDTLWCPVSGLGHHSLSSSVATGSFVEVR